MGENNTIDNSVNEVQEAKQKKRRKDYYSRKEAGTYE